MLERIQADSGRSAARMTAGLGGEMEKGVVVAGEAQAALEQVVTAANRSADMIRRIAAAAWFKV